VIISRWRRHAAPIIARVLAEHTGADLSVIRKALRVAYPFGLKRMYPYRIWLDEIARQTGRKRKLGWAGHVHQAAPADPRQGALFAVSE
jgi:hypothetical protein